MRYCVAHQNKSYTEEEIKNVDICKKSGIYWTGKPGSLHVYCFRLRNMTCPLKREDKRGLQESSE